MNCDDLAPVMRTLSDHMGWQCRVLGGREDILEVLTGRVLSDGEPVRLWVRVDREEPIQRRSVLASDAGVSLSRLRDAGFDMDDSLYIGLWEQALSARGVSELDDRVFVQAPMAEAAEALNRLADTIVALDALSIVAAPKQARGKSLADEVENYLRQRPKIGSIRRKPKIDVGRGLVIQPSLAVNVPATARGEVLVQAGATSSPFQAYDHAFTTFGLAARANIPMTRRLTVLGGHSSSWPPARLRALGDVTFVGFWEHRAELLRFLEQDGVPEDTLLLPPNFNVPLFA